MTYPGESPLPGRDAQALSSTDVATSNGLRSAGRVPTIRDKGIRNKASSSEFEEPKKIVDILGVAQVWAKPTRCDRRISANDHTRKDIVNPETPKSLRRELATRMCPDLSAIDVDDEGRGGSENRRRISLEDCDLSCQLLWLPDVIVIQEREIGATGSCQSPVPSHTHARNRLDQHRHPGVASLKSYAIKVRTVVHDEDLKLIPILIERRGESLLEEWPSGVGRKDY